MINDRGNWMQMHSGIAFYPFDPRPEEILIEDIASHLSKICRYGGACNQFYSVAEHSVLVGLNCPKEYQLEGLLHDATEAFGMGDIVKPVKEGIPELKIFEDNLYKVIAEKFELEYPIPDIVKEIDFNIMADEQEQLMNESKRKWWQLDKQPEKLNVFVECYTPIIAETIFLNVFNNFKSRRKT